jgi:heptosyltransferase-1
MTSPSRPAKPGPDLLVGCGIDGSRPLVAINPVALWETKLWLNDRFAQLADRLINELRC